MMTSDERNKLIGRLCGYLVMSIAAGFVFLVLAYALPDEPIRSNIAASMSMFETDKAYPQWANGLTATNLDLWTDAVIMQEAAAEGSLSAVRKALLVPWFDYDAEVVLPHQTLRMYTEGMTDMTGYLSYNARYWHGYLIFLRPLFTLFSAAHIRVLNFALQGALFMQVYSLIERKAGKIFVLPFLVSWFIVNPVSSALSFQYSSMAYITLAALIVMMKRSEKTTGSLTEKGGLIDLFFFVGIATAYFDYLTYPLVGLGIPLCYAAVMRKKDGASVLKTVILLCFTWLAGYALMWMAKWVLATVMTGSDIITDGFRHVLFRLNSTEEAGTGMGFDALRMNLRLYAYKAFLVFMLAVMLYYIRLMVKNGCCIHPGENSVPFLCIALMPFFWVMIVRNHSIVHAYMVHRVFAVTLCGLLCMLSSRIRIKDTENV